MTFIAVLAALSMAFLVIAYVCEALGATETGAAGCGCTDDRCRGSRGVSGRS